MQNKEQGVEIMESDVLGKCPECGGDVIENNKAYGCANWKENNCKFTVWKIVAKKTITEAQAKKIILGEKVAVKGLTSKAGKKFGAYLKYDKNQHKVIFDGFLNDT